MYNGSVLVQSCDILVSLDCLCMAPDSTCAYCLVDSAVRMVQIKQVLITWLTPHGAASTSHDYLVDSAWRTFNKSLLLDCLRMAQIKQILITWLPAYGADSTRSQRKASSTCRSRACWAARPRTSHTSSNTTTGSIR